MLRCWWLCEVSGSGCMWTGLRWWRPSWWPTSPRPTRPRDWIPGRLVGLEALYWREAGEVMLIIVQAGQGEHAGHGGQAGTWGRGWWWWWW